MKRLSEFPRSSLGHFPTPLEPLPRLSALLGGPEIWIKRDDCSGLASGGNKTRKLEYLFAEALAEGADSIISFGALQSNHVRQTAAAAAKLGLSCDLILIDMVECREPAYKVSGNLLLDRILGANLHIVADDAAAMEKTREVIDRLSRAGRKHYVIPIGGSSAIGALGYVGCAQELTSQAQQIGLEIGSVVTAISSAGTQAGLVAGFAALRSEIEVRGYNVYKKNGEELEAALAVLCDSLVDLIEIESIAPAQQVVCHDYLGEGYGIPSEEMLEALRLVATHEGILLDPVYTGKAMAGLIGAVRNSESWTNAGGALVFLHTGGSPGLFAYREDLTGDG